jgi:hypothetical protein
MDRIILRSNIKMKKIFNLLEWVSLGW